MPTYKFVYSDCERTSEDFSTTDTSITFEVNDKDGPTVFALIEHFEHFLLATGYGNVLKGKYLDLVSR